MKNDSDDEEYSYLLTAGERTPLGVADWYAGFIFPVRYHSVVALEKDHVENRQQQW